MRNLKTGQETYISDREFGANAGEWKKLDAVAASGNGRFMALTGQEAFQYGLAVALINNREELARHYGVPQFQVLAPL